MNKETIDRLLDEGLRQYSRVEPPAGFSARLEQKIRAEGERRPSRWWMWLPAPVAVAAALALALMPHPAEVLPPSRLVAAMPVPSVQLTPNRGATTGSPARGGFARVGVAVRERTPVVARRSIHILTPTELASMQLPSQFFPTEPPAALTVPDLSISDVKVPALESEDKRSQ